MGEDKPSPLQFLYRVYLKIALICQPYLKAVRVGKNSDYVGADLARDWYERNLKIYANITRLNDLPNERILVVVGSGHLKLLREFVEQSGEFNLAKANVYF